MYPPGRARVGTTRPRGQECGVLGLERAPDSLPSTQGSRAIQSATTVLGEAGATNQSACGPTPYDESLLV